MNTKFLLVLLMIAFAIWRHYLLKQLIVCWSNPFTRCKLVTLCKSIRLYIFRENIPALHCDLTREKQGLHPVRNPPSPWPAQQNWSSVVHDECDQPCMMLLSCEPNEGTHLWSLSRNKKSVLHQPQTLIWQDSIWTWCIGQKVCSDASTFKHAITSQNCQD